MSDRIDLLKSLPRDLQVEITENMLREDFSESEKAIVQDELRKYFSGKNTQGSRNDLGGKTTSANMLVEVDGATSDKILSEVKDPDSSNILDKSQGSTYEKMAKVLGESRENVRKRENVFKNIDDETRKKLDSGKISLHSAYQKKVAKDNVSRPAPPLPKGRFNFIVQDPGWQFENKNIGGSGTSGASHKYKTQPTSDIARIPVRDIVSNDAIMFMWCTNQHLITGSMKMADFLLVAYGIPELNLGKVNVQSDALAVMTCHGFTAKHIITWHKEGRNGWSGYSFRNTTEHLIIGTRGKVAPFGLSDETMVSTQWDRNAHSQKPEEVWQLIDKVVETQKWKKRKLEMNCRTPRKGWLPHGDEITEKDIKGWK